MKRKGFTLVELLVVIAIIALLMGILMPALARVRMIAYRMICGTNLSGIGKAIMLYAGDAKETYPHPGVDNQTKWAQGGQITDWCDKNSYGPGADYKHSVYGGRERSEATIGSLFFLLIKYEDLSVKQFNCKGDSGVRQFKMSDWNTTNECPTGQTPDITKCWDFGQKPALYNSYSYNMPFVRSLTSGAYVSGLTVSSNDSPGVPLAADRCPTLDNNVNYLAGGTTVGGTALLTDEQTPNQYWPSNNEYKDPDLVYNSFSHQREGQNVLYNDGHVNFEKQANVGLDDDNIWQRLPNETPTKREREVAGTFPAEPTSPSTYANYTEVSPLMRGDALLVTEHQESGTAPTASDGRLKENIRPLEKVLEKIDKICGVTFNWNEIGKNITHNSAGANREIGVIAQDVETVFPELVVVGNDGYRRVDYAKMTAVLVEAVKELKAENDALKARIEALEAEGK